MDNATVTLPLSEVDKIREELKASQNQVIELQSHQKEVKVTGKRLEMRSEFQPSWVRDRIGEYKMVEHWVDEPVQYVNFDDVIAKIRKEEEQNVIEKLGDLERQVIQLKKDKEDLKTQHVNDLQSPSGTQQTNLRAKDTKIEELNRKIEDLIKQIAILKGEKVDFTKDEEIRNLRSELGIANYNVRKRDNFGFFARLKELISPTKLSIPASGVSVNN